MVLRPSGSIVNAKAMSDFKWHETVDHRGRTVWVLGAPGLFPFFFEFFSFYSGKVSLTFIYSEESER